MKQRCSRTEGHTGLHQINPVGCAPAISRCEAEIEDGLEPQSIDTIAPNVRDLMDARNLLWNVTADTSVTFLQRRELNHTADAISAVINDLAERAK